MTAEVSRALNRTGVRNLEDEILDVIGGAFAALMATDELTLADMRAELTSREGLTRLAAALRVVRGARELAGTQRTCRHEGDCGWTRTQDAISSFDDTQEKQSAKQEDDRV